MDTLNAEVSPIFFILEYRSSKDRKASFSSLNCILRTKKETIAPITEVMAAVIISVKILTP